VQFVLEGDVPSPIVRPSGCRFHPRCRYATKICAQQEPPLAEYGGGHMAACHHPLNIGVPAAGAGAGEPLPAVAGREVPAEDAQ